MPFKSKSQSRLFYAAANKKGGIDGLEQSTAKQFISDAKHQKTKGLPEKVRFKRVKKLSRAK